MKMKMRMFFAGTTVVFMGGVLAMAAFNVLEWDVAMVAMAGMASTIYGFYQKYTADMQVDVLEETLQITRRSLNHSQVRATNQLLTIKALRDENIKLQDEKKAVKPVKKSSQAKKTTKATKGKSSTSKKSK